MPYLCAYFSSINMKYIKTIIIVFFLFCLFISGLGQRSRTFRHLTINEGLAHTDATCFAQDSIGFMWIGTYGGLQRYDGNRLKLFRNAPEDVTGNRINALQVEGDLL